MIGVHFIAKLTGRKPPQKLYFILKGEMDKMIVPSSPLIMMLAIILTMMSSYAALNLFSLLNTSQQNRRFLFFGGTLSMGISIWVMNFLGLLANSMNVNENISFHLPIALLSLIVGISFTGMAFNRLTGKFVSLKNITSSSFFMTMSILSNHIFGKYSLNLSLRYNTGIMLLTLLVVFLAFLFTFWMLFYSNSFSRSNQVWLLPLSLFLITASVVEGHYLLTRATIFELNKTLIITNATSETFIIYLIIFVSIIILMGLTSSSALISKRLEYSDTSLRDITLALDESSIVAITDPKGIITYANDKFAEISKYSKSELVGVDHRILNSGYHTKSYFKNMWDTIGNGKVWKGEILNKAKDGTLYWVDTTIVPFLNKKGTPYQYISIRKDITAKKLAETNLTNSLKEISDIKFALDQSAIIAFTNEKGIITNVNEKFCEITKYDRKELIGQDHKLINSGYHAKGYLNEMWKTIEKGKVWKGELRNKAKDGSFFWVATTIVPFVDKNGIPYQYLSIHNDITERKRTEEILHRQDKLAAVGQLAAGVAHEIRNPLTSMKGYAEFLQLDETNPERQEYLDIILDEIDRVNGIVEEFMVLAKPKTANLEEKNIVPLINDVLTLLDFESRKKHVRLHFESSEDIIQVECDEDRLKQVFLNLVKNGIEAMPNGGDLSVKTNVQHDTVQISIQDTGVGISEEKLKKLGEPFFTTKEEGNGLGLMVSFKIIESHNGNVYIESEVNKGTTFNIVLPAYSA
jgi:PAS domain S-box-containing protein